ncbi:MAG: hypothetical protein ACJ74H_05390 [Thermoanaerobaculia bacterium]
MTGLVFEVNALVGDDVRAAAPVGVLTPEAMRLLGLADGMRAIAVHGNIRVAIWICSTEQCPQTKGIDNIERDRLLWISWRTKYLLHVDGPSAPIELHVPSTATFSVMPAVVDDLPLANEVHVARHEARARGKWAIAYGDGVSVPVRLRARRVVEDTVRMSMLTRTLARVDRRGQIVIAHLQRERLHWRDDLQGRTSVQGIAGALVAAFYRTMRRLGWVAEVLLRVLFHSPPLPMTTIEAQLGDDTNRVIRIQREAFSLLGIHPGDDVFVEWADRRVIAVAHESFDTGQGSVIPTLDTWGSAKEVIPAARHLIVGIDAELRGELRIPRRTVVTVRRRVTSIFARRLNEVTVPVGGLLLAAAAIPDFPFTAVVVGTFVVTVFAMLPARYRVPPKGRWP